MLFFFAFVVSLAVSMALIPPLVRMAGRLHAVDVPDERKIHKTIMPRVGGIAMALGSLLPIAMWVPFTSDVQALLWGAMILLVFGIWDDRVNLDYHLKFLGQLIAAVVVVMYGDLAIRQMPFVVNAAIPDYVAVPLTVFALVGITNAINLADGLDGLAGGTTLLSLGCIAMLAYLANGTEVVLIALAIMGGILGFLRHNTYPARIFMGDTGSQFLGFTVGVLALILTQKTSPSLSPVMPILLLGLPILDTLAVMTQRIYEGRSPFSPDKNHIHHKLLRLGFDHYEAVLLIYVIQTALVVGAYVLRYESDALILGLYAFLCLLILVLFRVAGLTGWRLHCGTGDRPTPLSRWRDYLRRKRWLASGPYYFAKFAIPLFLLGGALLPSRVSPDFSILSLILVAVAMLSFYWKRLSVNLIERAAIYGACAFVVYLLQVSPGAAAEYGRYINVFYYVLAMAVAVGIRFSKPANFQATPLDYLVILIAVIVPNLPEFSADDSHLGELALKLIVLFYGSEMVISLKRGNWDMLRVGTISSLLVLGFRGLT